ncbi:MAG: hypothetical protein ACRERD_15120, partial [Candidatus Binatia bacterium]
EAGLLSVLFVTRCAEEQLISHEKTPLGPQFLPFLSPSRGLTPALTGAERACERGNPSAQRWGVRVERVVSCHVFHIEDPPPPVRQ